MRPSHHHPIILTRLPSTRFSPQNLNIDKRQIPPDLVAPPLDDQRIALLGRSNVGRVDVDRDTSLGETIRRGGRDDDASDPVDDRGGGGAVEDVLAVHEGFRDGHVRFDKACGDCLDYQLAGEKGDELGAVVKDE